MQGQMAGEKSSVYVGGEFSDGLAMMGGTQRVFENRFGWWSGKDRRVLNNRLTTLGSFIYSTIAAMR